MAFRSGDGIGPYRVLDELGEGGMGEVYRATDTNLTRDVAIKVLPEAVAVDPEWLARFQREAQVLAALTWSLPVAGRCTGARVVRFTACKGRRTGSSYPPTGRRALARQLGRQH
jgi:serine/threonine protein kinase